MSIPTDRRGQPRLRLRLPVRLDAGEGTDEGRGEVVEISEQSARLIVNGGRQARVGQEGRVRFQVDPPAAAALPSSARGDRTVSILRVRELADGRQQVVVRFC